MLLLGIDMIVHLYIIYNVGILKKLFTKKNPELTSLNHENLIMNIYVQLMHQDSGCYLQFLTDHNNYNFTQAHNRTQTCSCQWKDILLIVPTHFSPVQFHGNNPKQPTDLLNVEIYWYLIFYPKNCCLGLTSQIWTGVQQWLHPPLFAAYGLVTDSGEKWWA